MKNKEKEIEKIEQKSVKNKEEKTSKVFDAKNKNEEKKQDKKSVKEQKVEVPQKPVVISSNIGQKRRSKKAIESTTKSVVRTSDKKKKTIKIIKLKNGQVIEKFPKIKKIPPLEKAVRYKVKEDVGLTSKQVKQRQIDGYTNTTFTKTTKSYARILLDNVFTFFNILCLIIAAALIAVGAYSDLVFMVVFVLNTAIAVFQEIRAKKTVEKISLLTSPTAVVVRDGVKQTIKINEIVLDDVVFYELGKQICADSILLSGEVEVNESLLTGESVPIKKKPGDILYSGSFVSSGKCYAKVDKIGDYNYSSTLVTKAQTFKKKKSELLYSITLIIKVIGFIIIPLGVASFLTGLRNPDVISQAQELGVPTYHIAVQKTAGSMTSMVPAGMYLLTTMALAVGVLKLIKKRTLVQDLYSIEMLSRADVICLDKTGTITDGTMKVSTVIHLKEGVKSVLQDVVGSMLTALEDNNQTSQALASYFGYSKKYSAQTILPFSSQRKLSAVTFKGDKTYAMGAPEYVLKTKDQKVEKLVNDYAQKGYRVLVIASSSKKIDKEQVPQDMKAIAVVVIEDRIRENAAQTLAWFRENGVDIKIISGDNPITVSEVSKRVGVLNADKYISLEGLTKQQVVEAANKYTIFGRVSPEQKCILVKALKADGRKVAMTGDGVNDILALKEADCSIAMASGSEAARNVSQVVLLDSNFSSMPSIVEEGRRVVNNISKSASLFLMKTFFSIILNLILIIIQVPFPFNTRQLILLEFFVIGMSSFVLALQPNKEPIKGNFLYNLISKALPGAFLFVLSVICCYIFDKLVGAGTNGQYVTMAALTITFTGLCILYRLCKPYDLVRSILIVAVTVSIILCLSIAPIYKFIGYEKLTLTNALMVVVLVQIFYIFYSTVVKMTDILMSYFKKKSRSSRLFSKNLPSQTVISTDTIKQIEEQDKEFERELNENNRR